MTIEHAVNRLKNLQDSLDRARSKFERSFYEARNEDQRTGSQGMITITQIVLDNVEAVLRDLEEVKPRLPIKDVTLGDGDA